MFLPILIVLCCFLKDCKVFFFFWKHKQLIYRFFFYFFIFSAWLLYKYFLKIQVHAPSENISPHCEVVFLAKKKQGHCFDGPDGSINHMRWRVHQNTWGFWVQTAQMVKPFFFQMCILCIFSSLMHFISSCKTQQIA